MTRSVFRAGLVTLLDDPAGRPDALVHHADGGLVVEDGHIVQCDAWERLAPGLRDDDAVHAYPGALIMPGFVDAHVHFPQVDIIGAHGLQLMDWLERYTFPCEEAFADADHARATAAFFLDELLRNGTTSALVFATVHGASVEALFEAALSRDMRLIGGKVLMDRNAPDALLEEAEAGTRETERLIRTWRGRGRLGYAITPRFAPTSTPAQLEMAGQLLADHPDVLLHTHLAENQGEIAFVSELFPEARDYLDVYDRAGLLGNRSVFAHGVHLNDDARGRLCQAGAALAHCPTSNTFLGSGLFDLATARDAGVRVALGSDVGAGTSLSLWSTMGEAYKVAQLRGSGLDPVQALYLATLGGARALHMGDRVGSLEPGKEADFVVVDPAATPLLSRRRAVCNAIEDLLFMLAILGDDRCIAETRLMGRAAHRR